MKWTRSSWLGRVSSSKPEQSRPWSPCKYTGLICIYNVDCCVLDQSPGLLHSEAWYMKPTPFLIPSTKLITVQFKFWIRKHKSLQASQQFRHLLQQHSFFASWDLAQRSNFSQTTQSKYSSQLQYTFRVWRWCRIWFYVFGGDEEMWWLGWHNAGDC